MANFDIWIRNCRCTKLGRVAIGSFTLNFFFGCPHAMLEQATIDIGNIEIWRLTFIEMSRVRSLHDLHIQPMFSLEIYLKIGKNPKHNKKGKRGLIAPTLYLTNQGITNIRRHATKYRVSNWNVNSVCNVNSLKEICIEMTLQTIN